jgi:hypothetical protein
MLLPTLTFESVIEVSGHAPIYGHGLGREFAVVLDASTVDFVLYLDG